MKMSGTLGKTIAIGCAMVALMSCGGDSRSAQTATAKERAICVFVPGMAKGSPIYEQMVLGATRAVAEISSCAIEVIEGGFDQSTWKDQLSEIASSGKYELIVTSNPAMPELCALVAKDHPQARFFVADGYKSGNPAIHTVLYNQYEQGYLAGYLAGLVSTSSIEGTDPALKAAVVVAQEYSTFNEMILPGFKAGLQAIDAAAALELRVVGSWSDAKRASELADALYDGGVDVILPVVGGGSQGVFASAKAKGKYAVFIDGKAGYSMAPGIVVGCSYLDQERLVFERVKAILSGELSLFGRADVVGAAGGYVGFDESGEAFKSLPEPLKAAMMKEVESVKAGRPDLAVNPR
jgi:simple sugar transport system substrate-binding protein